MMDDAVSQAEEILRTTPEPTLTLSFSDTYRARRALTCSTTLFRRPDLEFWGARILGTDPKHGLKREFLPKTWPAVYARRASPALDCSAVEVGDVIQFRGQDSRTYGGDRFFRVLAVSDDALALFELSDRDVAGLYR